jgi:hypothetical protein
VESASRCRAKVRCEVGEVFGVSADGERRSRRSIVSGMWGASMRDIYYYRVAALLRGATEILMCINVVSLV